MNMHKLTVYVNKILYYNETIYHKKYDRKKINHIDKNYEYNEYEI